MRIGDDGRLLVMCRAGCPTEDILNAIDWTMADLAPPDAKHIHTPSPHAKQATKNRYASVQLIAQAACRRWMGQIESIHVYFDENNQPVFGVVRLRLSDGGKEMPQIRPEAGAWVFGGVRRERPLYRLPQILASNPDQPVCLFEGELKADLGAQLGFVSTSCSQGAGNAHLTNLSSLSGRILHLFADNDAAGEKHMTQVAKLAYAAGARIVRNVTLPGLPAKGDILDYYNARHAAGANDEQIADEVRDAVAKAVDVERVEAVPDRVLAIPSAATAVDMWPAPLGPAVRVGLLGEFLEAVESQTEADPAAITADLLVRVGNAVGTGPHFTVSGDRHGCNLYLAIAGPTATGRKGSSAAYPRQLMELADPKWSTTCVKSGLSSGEGIIEAIRDPMKTGTDKKTGQPIFDDGVADKRLLLFETELSRCLRAGARRDSTLFPVLRQAWEGGRLASLTRQPYSAAYSHISLLSHVARDEFVPLLSDLDIAGGTINRILFVASRRQRVLPFGGHVPTEVLNRLASRLRSNIETARRFAGEYEFTEAACSQWPEIYTQLAGDEEASGLSGQLMGRAVAQTRRLAMVLAIIDGEKRVDVRHIAGAVEFWNYCKSTVRYVFGSLTGNRTADRILAELVGTEEGLDKTGIHKLFGRHVSASSINEALELLRKLGMAKPESASTSGRPREVWRVTRRTGLGVAP